MSALLLPANLAPLSKLCADGAARYSMQAVQVSATATGYRAEATNGKFALRIKGEADIDPSELPVPALHEPSTADRDSALIPAEAWDRAFKALPRGRKLRSAKPALARVGVKLMENESILATTDLDAANVARARNCEGRFPDLEAVIPAPAIVTPADPLSYPPATAAVVRLDARLLKDLLSAIEDINEGTITLEVRDGRKPIVVRAENATQKAVGLLMPLT